MCIPFSKLTLINVFVLLILLFSIYYREFSDKILKDISNIKFTFYMTKIYNFFYGVINYISSISFSYFMIKIYNLYLTIKALFI